MLQLSVIQKDKTHNKKNKDEEIEFSTVITIISLL